MEDEWKANIKLAIHGGKGTAFSRAIKDPIKIGLQPLRVAVAAQVRRRKKQSRSG